MIIHNLQHQYGFVEQALSGPTGVLKAPSPAQHYQIFASLSSCKLNTHISVQKQFSVVFHLEKFFLTVLALLQILAIPKEKKDKEGKCINLNAA